jgi:hypothetical protein
MVVEYKYTVNKAKAEGECLMKNLFAVLMFVVVGLVGFANEAQAYCDSWEFVPAANICHTVDSNNHPVKNDDIKIFNGAIYNSSTSIIRVRCSVRSSSGYFVFGNPPLYVPMNPNKLDSFTVYYSPNNTSHDPYFDLFPTNIETRSNGSAIDSVYLDNDGFVYAQETMSSLSFPSGYQFLTIYTELPAENGSNSFRLHGFKICYEEW